MIVSVVCRLVLMIILLNLLMLISWYCCVGFGVCGNE